MPLDQDRNGFDDTDPPRADKPPAVPELLSLQHWLARTLPLPDFLLGDVISTTSRIEIIGPTGLGKTNFGLALASALAGGRDFLHWRGSGRSQRVLYVDGEMSRRLMQGRLRDAVRRQDDFERLRDFLQQYAGEVDLAEDEEIGLGENDTDRPTGAMPKNAMDAARLGLPDISHIVVGADGSYALGHPIRLRRGASVTETTMELARKLTPDLPKVGAL